MNFKDLIYISSAGIRVLLTVQEELGEQGEMKLGLITDDPKQNIGIRIVSQISRAMDYNNLFNLNS